jgi:uncharacterized membrane protein
MRLSNKTIVGVAVVLFGAVLLGAGMHHTITTGTCSSTGYSAHYGPVPYCPAGTGWWIGFLTLGIMLVVFGSLLSGGYGFLVLFLAIGIGAMSVATERHPASGSKIFGLIFGGFFAAGGGIPLLVMGLNALRSRSRRTATTVASSSGLGAPSSGLTGTGLTGSTDAILGAYAAAKTTPPTPGAPIGSPGTAFSTPLRPPSVGVSAAAGSDPLAKIERLSKLHQDGALTDAEFQREKERLLAQL